MPGYLAACSTHLRAPSVAMACTSARLARKTTRRCRIDVEL
ncbi:Uncharacterised protein [Mycobacterium tuberculosis]|nr:Uncharacterised protein [Mycobacterium tuberculosis]